MAEKGINELHVLVVGLQVWHLSWLFFCNFILYLVYHFEPNFLQKYKVNNDPWPWYVNRDEWVNLMKRSCWLIFLNNVISVSIIVYIDLYLSGFQPKYSFAITDLPSSWKLLCTFIFLMLCEDVAFHFFHRLAHHKLLYPHFHKYHHNYTTTVSLAGEHFHPVDFFTGALIPVSLGPLLLGTHLHITTYLIWIVLRTMESVDAHSGFEFPWTPFRIIPFAASATYHDYHHSHNKGNYSSFFTLWDSIMGQNTEYYRYQAQLKKND